MTIVELRDFVQNVSLDSNAKVVILVAKYADDDYKIVACDEDGKLITTSS